MTVEPSQDLRICLIQLRIRDGSWQDNQERATLLLRGAPRADVYLLPELWTTGYAHQSWQEAAGATPAVVETMVKLAAERDALIGGSMVSPTDDGGLSNRFWLLGGEGVVAHYDKVHLFAPMNEPRYLRPGTRRMRAPVRGWSASLSICFDLRYPEMYRLDAVDGADLFLVVAEWPAERADALLILARARAVENQAYVAVVNRAGTGADGTVFGGGSLLVAPDGVVVAAAGEPEDLVVGSADRSVVSQQRRGLQVLAGRMPGVDTAGRGTEGAPHHVDA